MLTHSDLVKCGDNEEKRIKFVQNAITDFQQSDEYKVAVKATEYYYGRNPEIAALEKIIYDMKGIAHVDAISPNNKIRNGYFPLIIDEAVSHLLANGISFTDADKKEALGKDFDDVTKTIYREALVCKCSYGFFNGEKTIHLPYAQTVQVLDDYNGSLNDCIFFSQVAEDKPKVITLYEPDGFTEYVQEYGQEMKVRTKKEPYRYTTTGNKVEGVYLWAEEQESRLPIIPMYSPRKQSMLVGNLEILIALDLMASQLVNNVSQAELVYWVLKNYGGMDDIADANFIVNLIKSHVIHVEDDGSAEPHQIQVPFEANNAAYARLKAQLFENMRGVNHEVMDAGNLTATAINSAYSRLRNFSGLAESNVFNYVRGIMKVAGIDENETFSVEYYETINPSEAIQNTIASAPYLSEEAVTKKLAMLNGLGDELEEIQKQRQAEQLEQFQLLAAQNAVQGGSDGIQV